MAQKRFDFLSSDNKEFIIAFSDALDDLGYFHDDIGSGFCWGRNMVIYRKAGVKSKNVYARIYIRDDSICLRLFFNNVTAHGGFIEKSPDYIKSVFVGEYGNCKHCKGDNCKFRKDYEIGGTKYEKCNGLTFEFYEPTSEKLAAYLALFEEFYPKKQKSK